jgi:hypothetical protein
VKPPIGPPDVSLTPVVHRRPNDSVAIPPFVLFRDHNSLGLQSHDIRIGIVRIKRRLFKAIVEEQKPQVTPLPNVAKVGDTN